MGTVGSNIVGSNVVLAPGAQFGGAINSATPHPAVGTGGTWFDVESTAIWDDEDAADPAELTEAEDIKRIDVNEAGGSASHYYASANIRYSPVTHATPNGKPAIYSTTDALGTLGTYYNAAKASLQASGELAGREFGRVMVLKRLSATDNVEICRVGSSSPMNVRTEATNKLQVYGSVSGYSSVDSLAWTNGDYAVVAFRWNESTTELEVSVNGGAWQATTTGSTGWSPDTGNIALGNGAWAIAFDWYFDGDPDTLGVHADLAAFILALGDYYGLALSLIADLTTAAGSAPTGLWVPGIATYKNASLDPCANGDPVYRIDDLTGNGYNLIERSAGLGGTYADAGAFGTRPTINFDRASSEGLITTINMDAGTANLLEAATYAQVAVLQYPDMNVSNAQANRNPAIFGQEGTNGRPYTVVRDTGDPPSQFAVGGAGGATSSGGAITYGTPHVASHRHDTTAGYGSSQDKTKASRQGSGALSTLAKKMYVAHNISDTGGTVYLSGDFGPIACFGADLSDGQLDAVVNVLRAFSGLSAV